jgi:hypothetical protein
MPSATSTVRGTQLPPDQEFWQRYSPHHEFPLSGVSSVAIHVLALVLLFFLGRLLVDMLTDSKTPLRELGVVVLPPGGGGGNPKGVGNGPGALPIEDVGANEPESNTTPPDQKRPQLNVPPIVPLPPDEKGDPVLEEAARARQKLRDIIRGHGKKGPGRDGGPGKEKDTGTRDKTGPGDGDIRLARMDRWVMVFDTSGGDDYARQLHGLDAIIVIPRAGNQYFRVRDLSHRPAELEKVDIESIKRIYWEDNKRESIAPLCLALGIRPVPGYVIAFFPEELERKLLKIELQYKGLREDQIKRTRFKVRKMGGGYEPVVVDQKAI